MTLGEATRWTLIRRAAAGAAPEQEEFALLYGPVARAFFATRWRNSPLAFEVEDAAQDVLLACLKEGGALSRADSAWPGGFRAFFRGILRKTALQVERRHARHRDIPPAVEPALDDLPADDPGLSTVFDQTFAEAMVREAVRRHEDRARERGGDFQRRFALLQLRFREGLPIREIAKKWGEAPERVHNQYRQARLEFREALMEVVAFHQPGTRAEVEEACERLLQSLS
jgi:RNA polymerase sigma-70 factor (ECF subfamily)